MSTHRVVPLGLKKVLLSYGISNVIELDWWESRHITVKTNPADNLRRLYNKKVRSGIFEKVEKEVVVERELDVTCLPVRHWSARTPFDRNETLWGSFAVASAGG